MGDILRKGVEERRKKLIEKLIAYDVYKKDDEHLYGLLLSELESEYRKLQSQAHPHDTFGSIKWNRGKSKE